MGGDIPTGTVTALSCLPRAEGSVVIIEVTESGVHEAVVLRKVIRNA